ncbi:MAG: hypothetical protein WAK20_02655, partial [Candidatus Acidiferrum sp.]
MSTAPVTLDFSKAQPIPVSNAGGSSPVTLDFSKAQPLSNSFTGEWDPKTQKWQDTHSTSFTENAAETVANIVKGQVKSYLTGGGMGAGGADASKSPVVQGETFNPFHPVETAGYLVPQPIKDIVNMLQQKNYAGAAGKGLALATQIPVGGPEVLAGEAPPAAPVEPALNPEAAVRGRYEGTAAAQALQEGQASAAANPPTAAESGPPSTPGTLATATKKINQSGAPGAIIGGAIGHAVPVPGGTLAGAMLGRELWKARFGQIAAEAEPEAAAATVPAPTIANPQEAWTGAVKSAPAVAGEPTAPVVPTVVPQDARPVSTAQTGAGVADRWAQAKAEYNARHGAPAETPAAAVPNDAEDLAQALGLKNAAAAEQKYGSANWEKMVTGKQVSSA